MTDEPETVQEAMARLLAGERTTGMEWLGALMEGAGHVHFNSLWVVFSVGQAGMALQAGSAEVAAEMTDRLAGDIDDLDAACRAFVELARSMHANAAENVKGALS